MDINIKKIESPLKTIHCRFVSRDMKKIKKKTLCYKYNQEVAPDEDDVVVCQKCEIKTSSDQCKNN